MSTAAIWGGVKAAENTASDHDTLPDGDYTMNIDWAGVKKTKKKEGQSEEDRKDMIVWELRVTDGPHTKRKFWKNDVLTEKKVPYIKADLALFGIDENIAWEDLPDALLSVKDTTIHATIKTNGQYVNCYFNAVTTDDDILVQPVTAVPEEDIPF